MDDEKKLKDWFFDNFNKWFDIYADVEGVAIKDSIEKKLISDFIILPKQELRNVGINGCLGVEVKYISIEKNFFSESSKIDISDN